MKFLNSLFVTVAVFASPVYALEYPVSPRGDVVDDYHGQRVADPYRWLEDVDAPEVAQWVQAQNRVTQSVLKTLPGRERLQQRLTELWNYEKYGTPVPAGDALFYRYNNGLQKQSVLLRQQGEQRTVVLDPNQWSADGTSALTVWKVSPNGHFVAYGVAEAGSDWNRFRIRDTRSGSDLDEVLDYIKFSNLSWTQDSGGFFYSRYPGKDGVFGELKNQALYYHRLGHPQSDDVPIFADNKHPRYGYSGTVSDDGRYLIISVRQGTGDENMLYLRDLRAAHSPHVRGRLIPIVEDFSAKYQVIGVHDGQLYVWSTDQAPRGRILSIDIQRPSRRRELVAQTEYPIEQAHLIGQHLAIGVLKDAVSELRIYPRLGGEHRVAALPGLGSASELQPAKGEAAAYFSYSDFFNPPQQSRLDLASASVSTLNRSQLPLDTDVFAARQVFYTSADGTRIPMFILQRKDLPNTQAQAAMLYGYGGFSISLSPSFKPQRLAWLEQGGIYAIANLRGGGEYGEAWHQAGTLRNKQNVFDDFIAAAEYLIESGLSSPEQLAISGRSNGGLLVGAVSNQRPDLFAAALPGVGVMDMLRFHKFTIGWAWTDDYGSSDDPAVFPALRAYSPLHNVPQAANYPATMVTTADHDDRVVPGHSFKFAAALQHASPGPAPKLIRIESKAGHGRGMPTDKIIAQAADELAFAAAFTQLDMRSRTPWPKLVEHGDLAAH
ncbi:MAG: prolyl oligopeptidase family serine peptidase [Oceanococcus sp.]